MLNQYGIPTVAEKKYATTVRGIIMCEEKNIRVLLFASFIEITEYNEGDFEFYLKAVYFMTQKW